MDYISAYYRTGLPIQFPIYFRRKTGITKKKTRKTVINNKADDETKNTLRSSENVRPKRNLDKRMTYTIFFICLWYLVSGFPFAVEFVLVYLDVIKNTDWVHYTIICFSWSQCIVNFFIYVYRKDEYFNAYIDFLHLCRIPCLKTEIA